MSASEDQASGARRQRLRRRAAVTAGDRPDTASAGDRPDTATTGAARTGSDGAPSEDVSTTELEQLVGWFDARTGLGSLARTGMRKVFPDHWSFLLGEIALFCFVILLATGTYLTFFYVPAATPVTYQGPYTPLDGTSVSAAFASVMHLSFEVRAGLLFRQIHHWAALVFVAAIVVHACRIFFTGAFRRPREVNYLIGIGLLMLVLVEGFSGYSLPDDLLSGTGLRILYSIVLSIPFLGPWIANLIFGGTFPSAALISRLFVLHILLVPGILIGGILAHLAILVLQKHTQYRGGRATEGNVIGRAFWPGQAFRSLGLFFLTAAVLALIGGLIEINPVWKYGPYIPYAASAPAQPDWYMGWLEGAVRLGLPIEPTIFGVTIPSLFVPALVIPGILMGIVTLWPFIEPRITGDHAEHHLLDAIWAQPVRLATGSAILATFFVLTLAGGNDVLAVLFNVGLEEITDILRILAFVVPVITWFVAWRLAKERVRRGQQSVEGRLGGESIRRTASGGYAVGHGADAATEQR
jgi:quinol---cytochrome-c reductase cytochrome b subunit